MKINNVFTWAALCILSGAASVLILNLDLLLRWYDAYQQGTLSTDRVHFDLAAFDFGQRASATPVRSVGSSQDGMALVYIPAGEFLMGDNDSPRSSPAHKVHLEAYWMDRVEVTNAMYQKCVKAGGCALPDVHFDPYYGKWAYRDHPVVYINWFQAQAYCKWAGRRLPTEVEWEKAARGTDGRKYPWGDEAPTPRLANFDEALIQQAISSYRYPSGASPFGVLNMSGNVREWLADWFDPNYYEYSPYTNPKGPEAGTERALRSGSYAEDRRQIAVYVRLRHSPDSAGLNRGFRCAQDAQAGSDPIK